MQPKQKKKRDSQLMAASSITSPASSPSKSSSSSSSSSSDSDSEWPSMADKFTEFYAGPKFKHAPHPSELPLPVFKRWDDEA
jgi:hypothetical protein